jgi:hypothetical protein
MYKNDIKNDRDYNIYGMKLYFKIARVVMVPAPAIREMQVVQSMQN